MFLAHVVSGSQKALVLGFGLGRDVNPFDLAASEALGQFPAVNTIGLACALFVFCGHIGRIDYDALDTLPLQLAVDPEAGEAGFIASYMPRPGNCA